MSSTRTYPPLITSPQVPYPCLTSALRAMVPLAIRQKGIMLDAHTLATGRGGITGA